MLLLHELESNPPAPTILGWIDTKIFAGNKGNTTLMEWVNVNQLKNATRMAFHFSQPLDRNYTNRSGNISISIAIVTMSILLRSCWRIFALAFVVSLYPFTFILLSHLWSGHHAIYTRTHTHTSPSLGILENLLVRRTTIINKLQMITTHASQEWCDGIRCNWIIEHETSCTQTMRFTWFHGNSLNSLHCGSDIHQWRKKLAV